jgi:hypothetical protein
MTITEFLEARIAEDEEQANKHLPALRSHGLGDYGFRVLAECEAKQAIIKAFDPQSPDLDPYVGRDVIAMLAAVYKDHPEYRQEWAG